MAGAIPAEGAPLAIKWEPDKDMRHDTAIPVLRQWSPAPPVAAAHPLRSIEPSANPAGPVRSLYLHVPFCFHKCHYCDFYSIVDTRDRQAPFVDRLIEELRAIAPWAGPLETIFVGGGTPTLLQPQLWRRLLQVLHAEFDLMSPRLEFTVECNPETATAELMAILREGGVNRLSIGAQSFHMRHLKTLERWHDAENVPRAIELARQAGIEHQSIDLIFGIPGQTLPEWESDLGRALNLGLTHLSCYDLTYEPNTPMTVRLKRGEFDPAPEDLEIEMFESTLRLARASGLERYEVSNYARPGDECRHNLAYWRQEQWLAAGPSASAHVAGHRWKNVPRLDDYLAPSRDGVPPVLDDEPPDPARALRELIMTGLRLAEGLETHSVLSAADSLPSTHHPITPSPHQSRSATLLHRARRLENQGYLTTSQGRWRLTDAGVLIADRIAADLMATVGGNGKSEPP